MKRRGFFRRIFSAVAAFVEPRWAGAQAPLPPDSEPAMRELARVVLPASLGQTNCDQVAASFVKWVRGYQPGAEVASGYGSPRTQVTGPNPAAHYAEQLRQLNLASLASADAKKSAVAKSLEESKIDRIPQRPSGKHVAADLLAYFYNSSGGEDFLYRAAIRRDDCRGLADSGQRPRALT